MGTFHQGVFSLCQDPTLTIPASSSTTKRDTLEQLRELYNAVKKKTKNKEEEEEPAHCQEDRWPGPAHFLGKLHTTDTGREQPEEERKQMNDISYQ